MRIAILGIGIFFIAGATYAATLACDVPTANVVRSAELCEELRVRLRVRTADWDNDVCATEVLRIGLIEVEKRVTKNSFTQSANTVVRDAVSDFTSTWPPATPAICGDGTLDTEFGEECDDGNQTPGDGCDSRCLIE